MAPSSGNPSPLRSRASNTGELSKRGMQHQTMLPPWSTKALTVQLPIGASSSVAGLRGERGNGVMKQTFRDVGAWVQNKSLRYICTNIQGNLMEFPKPSHHDLGVVGRP